MTDTSTDNAILIVGAGPGISAATARRFGKEGYKVGLISLKQEEAVKEQKALEALCVTAFAFSGDASNAQSITNAVKKAKKALGVVSVLHYNAYSITGGNLLETKPEEVASACATAVTGLVASVQLLLEDLKSCKGAVLVTSSGVGQTDVPGEVEEFLVGLNISGYLIAKAAQHRCIMQLIHKLKPEGVFVGKVNVQAIVKGTAWDDGTAKIETDTVAEAFWKLLNDRSENLAVVENPAD